MIASQAVAPIAGVWPWLKLVMAALLPGAASIDVGRALACSSRTSSTTRRTATRSPTCPTRCVDLGAADAVAEPLQALADALDAARDDPRARRGVREGARRGSRGHRRTTTSNPGDPALLDVPTMCDNLAGAGRTTPCRRRPGRWATSCGSDWCAGTTPRRSGHRGTSLYYKPVTPAGHRAVVPAGRGRRRRRRRMRRTTRTLALCEATGWHRIALNPLST